MEVCPFSFLRVHLGEANDIAIEPYLGDQE
jgi:hypothetical protein